MRCVPNKTVELIKYALKVLFGCPQHRNMWLVHVCDKGSLEIFLLRKTRSLCMCWGHKQGDRAGMLCPIIERSPLKTQTTPQSFGGNKKLL